MICLMNIMCVMSWHDLFQHVSLSSGISGMPSGMDVGAVGIHDSWFQKSSFAHDFLDRRCCIGHFRRSLGSPFLSPQTKWPSESLVLSPGFRTVAGDSLPIHKISMRVTLSEFHFWECQAECEVRFPDLEGALCPAQSYTDKGSMTAIAT